MNAVIWHRGPTPLISALREAEADESLQAPGCPGLYRETLFGLRRCPVSKLLAVPEPKFPEPKSKKMAIKLGGGGTHL